MNQPTPLHGARSRPPWWPEGEPWPPTQPPWVYRRRRFFRRLILLLIGVILFVAIGGGVLGWLFGGGFSTQHRVFFPFFPFFAFWPLLLIALAIAAVRGSRGWATRVGDLVEAAGRIESGDYSVRVVESGPSEVRSMARAFNEMTARLQATEKQRRSFLADVTHELKTPLSVIRGQAEGIADGVYPGDSAHVAPIIEATRTLERLVDDLRTLALSEAGSLALSRERVDLEVLINEALAAFRPQAEAAAVTLNRELSADLPPVEADPVRISGVLRNLLDNAITHTPRGGSVEVAARRAGDSVTVEVHDSGSGIAPDLLPRIFDRFVKGPGSRGSGLGLAIAKDVIAAHGGTIVAESPPGAGTTIRFTLPMGSH